MRSSILVSIFLSMLATSCAQTKKAATDKENGDTKTDTVSKDQTVRIKLTTDSGIIVLKLYDSTPLHRDNFVSLVNSRFYDSLLFHRVIPGFMIQGGDPQSKNAVPGVMLGNGGGDMPRIPAEFRKNLIHKRGALAAARDGNPQKASSACQFYIVQGKSLTDPELSGRPYTADQKNIYKTVGGTPFLDQEYTVFGEVESGMEIIDKIAAVACDQNNRPRGDIRMQMEILNNGVLNR